ncbi:MAG: hypothetical protein CME68_03540 [Halobacteriovoraceae bacterium]|nr:hypothetical protein [Halobacteriovoraceae bacterium]
MKHLYLATALFITLFTTQSFAAQKIKNCGGKSKSEVQKSLNFLHNHIEGIMNNINDLTNGEKRRLRRKVKNVNIKCMDHKPVCKNHSDRGGVERHIFNSAVVICYNRIRNKFGNNAFCKLTDVILHEIGHSASVKKNRGHNNGPNNDRVYRLGLAAEDKCDAKGKDRSIKKNTTK